MQPNNKQQQSSVLDLDKFLDGLKSTPLQAGGKTNANQTSTNSTEAFINPNLPYGNNQNALNIQSPVYAPGQDPRVYTPLDMLPFQNQTMAGPVAPPTTKQITAATPYDNNPNSVVQSDAVVTPGYGNNTASPEDIAIALNLANGFSSQDIFGQYMRDRTNKQGAFAIDPNAGYSPDQVDSLVNQGDLGFQRQIANRIQSENAKLKQAESLGQLTPRQSSLIQQVATNFESQPMVRNYIKLQSQYNDMLGSVGRGSGADDIATIYSFMKSLDPESVVRESEYDTGANKSGNIFQGYMAKFNGLINPNGGFVSETAKKNILKVIEDRYKVQEQQYKFLRDQKVKSLELRGVPGAGDFLVDYSQAYPDEPIRNTSQTQASSLGEVSSDWDLLN